MIVRLDAMLLTAVAFGAMTRSLSGTVSTVDIAPPALMVRAERQFQTFPVVRGAAFERVSKLEGWTRASVAPIDMSDLSPGEYVELTIDANGEIIRGRAIAQLECAQVASASGPHILLQDGRRLTIGSVPRFVTEDGSPSPIATVQPGEWILIFYNPRTWLLYRISAGPDASERCTQKG